MLASADALYGHFLKAPFRVFENDDLPARIAVVMIGTVLFASLVAAMRSPGRTDPATWRSGVLKEWPVVLGVVVAMFAGFVLVQATVLFGGEDYVQETAGLTLAEHARSGFWQLLGAVALSSAVLAVAWIMGGHEERSRRAFTIWALVLIVLDLTMLASAFSRLLLTEHEYGFTWVRLMGHTVMLAIGALLLCAAVAIAIRSLSWLAAAAVVVALVSVLGLDLLDPDAFIAEQNLSLDRAVDVDTLSTLSADATLVLVDHLPEHPAELSGMLACERDALARDIEDGGWWSFNASRDRALEALLPLDVGPCR